jgi:hypothetical protein
MLIIISPDELEPEFRDSWKMGLVTHPSIDYADNAVYAQFEGRQVTIFRFSGMGYVTDNRYNDYTVSTGRAGIMIDIRRSP